jgi:sporulation protein YlmC with PRC-barrel domain
MRVYTPQALPLAIAAFLSLAPVCHSQMPGKVDLEAAEAAAGLIGAPVFAIDGTEVGNVADVLFDDEGRPRRLRLDTAAHLGLGTRRVELPQGAFTALRGKVVLELPAEAVQALPEYSDASDEKG